MTSLVSQSWKTVLVLCAAVLLSGCGGLFARGNSSGGTGISTGALKVTRISSSITLPAGAVFEFKNHRIRTSGGTVLLDSKGRASVPIFNGGPQFAELLDASGRTAMLGFLSTTQKELSAESTASALLYLALAGPQLKAEGRVKLLEEASTLPGFGELATVISNQIRILGRLDLDADDFQAALTAAVDGSISRGRGVIAEPTTASGLSLDTTVQGKLKVENVRLRRVLLWLRRTGHIDASGKTVEEKDTTFTKIEMPVVARYGGITGTLDGYLKGSVAYSAVNSQMDLPRFPADAKQTNYTLYAVGPGGTRGDVFPKIPIELQDAQSALSYKTAFLDVFLVFVANVALPLKGNEVDKYLEFAAANAVITDIIGNLKTNIPDLGTKLGEGQYADALKLIATSTYTSNSILPAVAQVTLDYLYANTGINGADYDMLFNGMKSLLDKMGKIDVGFTAADLSMLAFDIYRSNQAEEFLIKVVPGNVTLQVEDQPVHPIARTKIRAIIQDKDHNGTYEYRWTVTPNGNYWLDDSKLNGTDDAPDGVLITSDDAVDINSFVFTGGVATARCQVIRVDGGRQIIGEEEVDVSFSNDVQPVVKFSTGIQVAGRTIRVDALPPFGEPDNYSYQFGSYVLIPAVKNAYRYELWEITGANRVNKANWLATRTNPYLGQINQALLPLLEPGQFLYGVNTGSQQGGWSTEAQARAELDKVMASILGFAGRSYEVRVTLIKP